MSMQPPVSAMKTHQIARAQNSTGKLHERVQKANNMVVIKDEESIKALLPDLAPERRKYPESEFRKHFLPVISGDAYKRLAPGYTADQLQNDAHRYWMQVAGGPNYEVEVVDDRGQTAFIVPAMMDTAALNTAQPKDHPGLRKLNHDVLQKAQGLPEVATRELLVGLERKLQYMTAGGNVDEKSALEKVAKIREYYGIAKAAEESATETPKADNFMGMMSFD